MDHRPTRKEPATPAGDFSQFWRIAEGDCELLSARYSHQTFGRHSHERYAIGDVIQPCFSAFSLPLQGMVRPWHFG